MTNKEILENNKLIAEFIGLEKYIYSKDEKSFYNKYHIIAYRIRQSWFDNTTTVKGLFRRTPLEQMYFHTSYDWLMPVVEKIEDMEVVASFEIGQPTIFIWKSSESSTFKDIEVSIFTMTKLQAVYKAVIKFIKWYNKKK